jgi:glycosyltransferase involved in cell wall biosynthesis
VAARPEVALTAFAVSWRGRDRLTEVVGPGIHVAARPFPARLARLAWSRSEVPSARWLAGPVDVVHGPNHVAPPGGGAAEVVTVHDLTATRYPELCTADVLQWPPLLHRALARGAWIHTVSETVAAEVRHEFPEAADRVVAAPNGIRRPPPATAASDAAVGRRLAGAERYVLALGTVEPRKELPTLVEAFDALAGDDPDLRLVIAGPDGWGVDALTAARDRCRHARRIVRLGWLGGDQRLGLLRGASVLAYPSRYEGFGLVPLEALSVGTPVVASDIDVHRETVADGAVLVAPGDADALAEALRLVLADDALAADLVARGQARVDARSWDRTVGQVVDLYHRAAAAR